MKKNLLAGLLVVLTLSSCMGKKDMASKSVAVESDTPIAALTDIKGKWFIENIVFSDSEYVRPAEAVPGSNQYIEFTDSTYAVMTNCNTMSGSYTIKGDSITLEDGLMTEMACDNMATEDALRRILPGINTVDVVNDSVVRPNSRNASEYIVLRKEMH